MKKITLAMAGLSLGVAANTGGNFGAGFILGEPLGFTFKLWTMPQKAALDFVVGSTNGWGYDAYGFSDPQCYNNNFYRNNTNYCLSVSNSGPDGRYGWRNIHLHGDYLIHNFGAIRSTEKLPIYYGPGLFMDHWKDGYYLPDYQRNSGFTEFGLRGVIGLGWIPRNAPFDVFIELAPIFAILPGPYFRMNGGLGGRYWF